MNGLTLSEVILGVLLPLVLGSYVYSWMGFKSVWDGLTETRKELKADIEGAQATINATQEVLNTVIANDLHHLEGRVERLEQGR